MNSSIPELEGDLNWQKAVKFIEALGLPVYAREITHDSFLPGIALGPACLYVDAAKLKYPGDILHEAGHLAVTMASDRVKVGTPEQAPDWPPKGEEMAAILWSYAAALHLEIDLEWLFHEDGYKDEAAWLLQNLRDQNYIGLPLLAWMGLCATPEQVVAGANAYPAMLKWLRD